MASVSKYLHFVPAWQLAVYGYHNIHLSLIVIVFNLSCIPIEYPYLINMVYMMHTCVRKISKKKNVG